MSSSSKPNLFALFTRLACGLILFGLISSLVRLPISAAASGTIVISQFRTRGPNGNTDEFIELYNLSAGSVDIGGWKINRSTSTGTTTLILTINSGTLLGPGCYFLATNFGYSGSAAGDQSYWLSVANSGGIGLLDASDTLIDEVGMSTSSAYYELDFRQN
jgi:hypothetical protein